MIKLKFCIDEDQLIWETLKRNSERYKGKRKKPKIPKEVIAFQNYAWYQSKNRYKLFTGRTFTDFEPGVSFTKQISELKKVPKYLAKLKKSTHYRKILRKTIDFKHHCEEVWLNNYDKSSSIMQDLTGLKFNRQLTVYITHPELGGGVYHHPNKIHWGHKDKWPSYTVIYLWHEIMHSYFRTRKNHDIDHAIIELLTDCELRSRLNGSKYPPFIGHTELRSMEKALMPYWKKHLKSKSKNIMIFRNRIVKDKNIQNLEKQIRWK